MQHLDSSEMQTMMHSSTLMQGTDQLPRVLLDTSNQSVIKFFYPRRRFSTNRIYPYCLRFKRNSLRLKKHGVQCPDVQEVYRINNHAAGVVHAIRYPLLAGQPLRSLLATETGSTTTKSNSVILDELALFMAALHKKGIFFRGIHMANLLYLPTEPSASSTPIDIFNTFALLDITTVKYSFGALPLQKRARNLKHLLHYRDDQHIFSYTAKAQFMQHYLQAARLSPRMGGKLIEKVFSKHLSHAKSQAK